MKARNQLAAILIFSIAWCRFCMCCEMEDVAVYRVKLNTFWNEDTSGYAHKAHLSQVFGQSHNKTYALYRIGEVSIPLVQEFIQGGDVDDIAEEIDEEPKIYDQFSAEADENGEIEAIVFVNGGHSLVSLISGVLPSQNWFVGVDSLDLCVHSSWIEEVTLDLDPLEAGTSTSEDQDGFKPVERVSQRKLARSNFYYRRSRQIQHFAKVSFTKVKEYSSKELNDLARRELLTKINHDDKHETIHKQFNQEYNFKDVTTKNPFEQLKNLEEDPIGTPRPNNPNNYVVVVTKAPKFRNSKDIDQDLQNMDEVVLAVANGNKLGLGKHLPRHFRSRLHHAVNKRHGKDCIVSSWGSWSPCSDPCSQTTRVRTVVQQKRDSGKHCGALRETRRCGRCVRGDGDLVI